MALENYAITTLERVKNYLAIQGAIEDYKEAFLEDQINLVSAAIETYCNRCFAIRSIPEDIVNGNGRSKLRPTYFPVAQLSIEESPSAVQKLASVQFRVDLESEWEDIETNVNYIVLHNPQPQRVTQQNDYCIELLNSVFPLGNKNIRLVYKAGEADSKNYAEVEMVAIEWIVMIYKQSMQGDSLLGLSSISTGAGGRNENMSLLNMKSEWKKVLDRYKVR
jgi:hypothetical protein